MTSGAAAQAAEAQKHMANDQKCTKLEWSCVPLAVESYGGWGKEAQECFALLSSRLAVHMSSSNSKNLALTKSIAKAIISRSFILADFVATAHLDSNTWARWQRSINISVGDYDE